MAIEVTTAEPRLVSVPAPLMRYTANKDDFDNFQRGGHEVFTMFNLAAQRYGGKPIRQFNTVLDFGCGAGRVMQYVPAGPRMFGCDVNAELVSFMHREFPDAEVYQNAFTPPLKYAAGQFDLVYCFSVFSHLEEENERAWLKELSRVGGSGCLYLVTVHGDWVIEATLGSEREAAEKAGFYYRKALKRHGTAMDFPEGYESSYHTSAYIRENWSRHFEILAIIRGDRPENYLWGDSRFMPEGVVPRFRPMGQDLVVMRKRSPTAR
jgi:SAM-dependent methyltransferase